MNNIISIITPSFNQGQFIERAIKSVLFQKGNFFIDYIIADAGSTDSSVEIIKKYDQLLKTKKYPIQCKGVNFKWWSRKDKGQSHALNQGFKISKGDILGWINCDDYYEQGSFELVAKKFKENFNVDLIYGDSYQITELNPVKTIIKFKQVDFSEMLNTGYQLNQPSVFFTKRILDRVGLLDENLHYAMDFDLWLRILKISKILYVPKVLATFELWKGCKGMRYEKKFSAETRKVCKKHDKNFLSQRNISMFFAKFSFVKYFKIKFPKFYKFCKKIILSCYKSKNMTFILLIKKIFYPVKQFLDFVLGKIGYSRDHKRLDLKYKALIREAEGVYKEFLFKDLNLSDKKRLELMSELLGTEISEAIYLLNYLNKSLKIQGDVCEFGIAQGATSALMAYEIRKTSKNIWLFDSFEGLPQPSEKDALKDDIFNLGSIEKYDGTMSCKEDVVKKRLDNINFPFSRVRIVPGFIEKTINYPNLPKKVCFAYIDFDLYEPTKIALNFLDKVLQKNGFIIIDDYDFFSTGPKKAVDEFVEVNKQKYNFLLPIKTAGHFCIIERMN